MQQPSQAQFLAEIDASARLLAGIASTCDEDLPVPSCPDWTMRKLATHVGRVHRWAAEIVTTRSQAYIPHSAVPDGTYPAEPAERAAWLMASAGRVIEAISEAGQAPVWAFGATEPASFWARRQAQETMMHRADAQLAAGQQVAFDPCLAADGIDEWLSMLSAGRRGGPDQPLPAGARLQLTATTPDGPANWLVTGTGHGLTIERTAGAADVTVTGRADRLLLAVLRRVPVAGEAVTVSGQGGLFSGWLDSTPF